MRETLNCGRLTSGPVPFFTTHFPMSNYTTLLFGLFWFCTTSLTAQEYGEASYYSDKFQGSLTYSEEPYDRDKLTAAHKSLAIGTRVRVTNIDNGRNVVVRINDRLPDIKGRVIDLSYAAAQKIGMISSGTAPVKIEKLGSESPVVTTPKPRPRTPTPLPKPAEVPTAVIEVPVPTQEKGEVVVTIDRKPDPAPKPKPKPAPKNPAPKPKPKSRPVITPDTPAARPTNVPAPVRKAGELLTTQNYSEYDLYKIEIRRPNKNGYGVQIASLSNYENMLRQIADLQGKGFDDILVGIERGRNDQKIYKVILRSFDNWDSANRYKQDLRKRYKIEGFVVDLREFR